MSNRNYFYNGGIRINSPTGGDGISSSSGSSGNETINNEVINKRIQSIESQITAIQSKIPQISNINTKLNGLTSRVEALEDSDIVTYNNLDTTGELNHVYNTGYINEQFDEREVVYVDDIDTSQTKAHPYIPTVTAIKNIPNIQKIPTVYQTYIDSSNPLAKTNTYAISRINSYLNKIPQVLAEDGTTIDPSINPFVYGKKYIDANMPSIISEKSTTPSSTDVYSAQFLNDNYLDKFPIVKSSYSSDTSTTNNVYSTYYINKLPTPTSILFDIDAHENASRSNIYDTYFSDQWLTSRTETIDELIYRINSLTLRKFINSNRTVNESTGKQTFGNNHYIEYVIEPNAQINNEQSSNDNGEEINSLLLLSKENNETNYTKLLSVNKFINGDSEESIINGVLGAKSINIDDGSNYINENINSYQDIRANANVSILHKLNTDSSNGQQNINDSSNNQQSIDSLASTVSASTHDETILLGSTTLSTSSEPTGNFAIINMHTDSEDSTNSYLSFGLNDSSTPSTPTSSTSLQVFNSKIKANKFFELSNSLTVSGISILNNETQINGLLSVFGNAQIGSQYTPRSLTIYGPITSNSSVSLGSSSSPITLTSSNVSINGPLDVSDSVSIDENLSVGGNITLSGKINNCAFGPISSSTTPTSTAFIPIVKADGIVEIGRVIDFHYSAGDTNNYRARILCDNDGALRVYNNKNTSHPFRVTTDNTTCQFQFGRSLETDRCAIIQYDQNESGETINPTIGFGFWSKNNLVTINTSGDVKTKGGATIDGQLIASDNVSLGGQNKNISLTGNISINGPLSLDSISVTDATISGTLNGCNIASNDSTVLSALPAIPIIKSDSKMEIGQFLDFHNATDYNKDYTSRIECAQNGTLQIYNSKDAIDVLDMLSNNSERVELHLGTRNAKNNCAVMWYNLNPKYLGLGFYSNMDLFKLDTSGNTSISGNLDIGRNLDFHYNSGGSEDYTTRIECDNEGTITINNTAKNSIHPFRVCSAHTDSCQIQFGKRFGFGNESAIIQYNNTETPTLGLGLWSHNNVVTIDPSGNLSCSGNISSPTITSINTSLVNKSDIGHTHSYNDLTNKLDLGNYSAKIPQLQNEGYPRYFKVGQGDNFISCTTNATDKFAVNRAGNVSCTGTITTSNLSVGGDATITGTLNGCNIASTSISSLGTRPLIPVIKSDSSMEIGSTIDFHTNSTASNDYLVRIQCETDGTTRMYNSGNTSHPLRITTDNTDCELTFGRTLTSNNTAIIEYNQNEITDPETSEVTTDPKIGLGFYGNNRLVTIDTSGNLKVGKSGKVGSIETNGSITAGGNATVTGSIYTTNGDITSGNNISSTGSITSGTTLIATTDLSVGGNATVTGSLTASDNVNLGGQNKTITLTGTIVTPTFNDLDSAISGKSPIGHTHVGNDITDLDSYISNYISGQISAIIAQAVSSTIDAIYPIGFVLTLTKKFNECYSDATRDADTGDGNIYYTWRGTSWQYINDGVFIQNGTTDTSGEMNIETGATDIPAGSDTHTHTTGDHTLTIDEIPSHNHAVFGAHTTSIEGNNQDCLTFGRFGSWATYENDPAYHESPTPSPYIGYAGGGGSHNHGDTGSASNVPRHIVCYMYKRIATVNNQNQEEETGNE